ncbi:helix-turn-helix transcriptional regulator [Halalkalibacterium halodurans]|uniref:helix-turn-helix domain-containing protein n=1 Tax=Halalkalibacterium halodurans TaxID=86665 RepID=UPI002E23A96E|nr:helix-turn-helix transcriptional regulator [Halalkalibacterium halodurans]
MMGLPGLKFLLYKNGLSAKDLESVTGKSTRTIQEYIKGDTNPPLPILIKVADHFDVSIDYLVGRKEYYTEDGKIETNNNDV